MHYVAELIFDESLEKRIVNIWRDLESKGIGGKIEAGGAKPHVSLMSCILTDPKEFCDQISSIASSMSVFEIQFESVGSFLTHERVLYLSPVRNENIERLHHKMRQVGTECGAKFNPFYDDGRWQPHCTLAMHLTPNELGEAVEYCSANVQSLSGIAERIEIVEINPPNSKTITAFPLRDHS
jgi:2'-5' RNA ligase